MTKSRDIANSTSTLDVDGGTIKLDGNYPVGSNNVALGDTALASGSLSGGDNTAIGFQALTTNTSGTVNTAVGGDALRYNTTGANNVSMGVNTLKQNISGSYNTGLGRSALQSNTTASHNTAVGREALLSNTTGVENSSFGSGTLVDNTTGSYNTALGRYALLLNTTASNNTAVGYKAGYNNTTGTSLVAIGEGSLANNTTANNNTAVGKSALNGNTTGADNTSSGKDSLGSNTTGSNNSAFGSGSLVSNTTASNNTAVGYRASYSNTTGTNNTCIGIDAGYHITTGSQNTIIGGYNGNYGGLDIRTSSNNIVLSDGSGNVRQYFDQYGNAIFPSRDSATSVTEEGLNTLTIISTDSGCPIISSNDDNNIRYRLYFKKNGTTIGSIVTSGSSTAYNTSSDHRLKENVDYTWDATTRLKQLKPARFNFIADGADTTVDGFLAHEAQTVVPECVTGTKDAVDDDGNPEYQGIDQSKLVPLLVKTIQELEARITALEGA